MANPEHLKILKQGVDAWNIWRVEDSGVFPDLEGADLLLADLSGINLSSAHLAGATLSGANLSGGYLGAANIRGASLIETNLNGAFLDNSDFTEAWMGRAVFGDNDLSTVKGLETVHHLGPSTIGIDTIYKSKGNIPEAFLRGAGVPETSSPT